MDKRFSHGLTRHPLYGVWQHIIQHCYNPKNKYYHNYGGRASKPIAVADEWRSPNIKRGHPENGNSGFINFYNWSIANGWKKGLSLDRIDNDGPYAPWNCRWTTMVVQQNNKRTNTTIVDYDGVQYTFSQFAHKYGFHANWVFHKFRRNWSFDAIVFAAHNPDLRIHRHIGTGCYIDKDGFMVLIPTIKSKRI